MSLIKVNELLQHATEHHYGVPAINVINTETIRYAIQAAEEHLSLNQYVVRRLSEAS